MRRVNAAFEDNINIHKYTLSGTDRRPTTTTPELTLYSYERPLYHVSDLLQKSPRHSSDRPLHEENGDMRKTLHTTHKRQGNIGSVMSDLSISPTSTPRGSSVDYNNVFAADRRSPLQSVSHDGGGGGGGEKKGLRKFFGSSRSNSLGSAGISNHSANSANSAISGASTVTASPRGVESPHYSAASTQHGSNHVGAVLGTGIADRDTTSPAKPMIHAAGTILLNVFTVSWSFT